MADIIRERQNSLCHEEEKLVAELEGLGEEELLKMLRALEEPDQLVHVSGQA
jgi:hypothetical protein